MVRQGKPVAGFRAESYAVLLISTASQALSDASVVEIAEARVSVHAVKGNYVPVWNKTLSDPVHHCLYSPGLLARDNERENEKRSLFFSQSFLFVDLHYR